MTSPNLIFVTGATGGARLNFFGRCNSFSDLTQKIGNLLCKLAIYCVNLGVNFILQKFCLCKKNDKYEVWTSPPFRQFSDLVAWPFPKGQIMTPYMEMKWMSCNRCDVNILKDIPSPLAVGEYLQLMNMNIWKKFRAQLGRIENVYWRQRIFWSL